MMTVGVSPLCAAPLWMDDIRSSVLVRKLSPIVPRVLGMYEATSVCVPLMFVSPAGVSHVKQKQKTRQRFKQVFELLGRRDVSWVICGCPFD